MDAWKNNDDMRAALADASNGTRDAPSGDWGEKTQNDYNEDNEGVAWEKSVLFIRSLRLSSLETLTRVIRKELTSACEL